MVTTFKISGTLDIADYIRRYKEMFGEPMVSKCAENCQIGVEEAEQKEKFAQELRSMPIGLSLVVAAINSKNNLFLLFKDKCILSGNEDLLLGLITDYIDEYCQIPSFIDNLFWEGIEFEMIRHYRNYSPEKEAVLNRLAFVINDNKDSLRSCYYLVERFLLRLANKYSFMKNTIDSFRYYKSNRA